MAAKKKRAKRVAGNALPDPIPLAVDALRLDPDNPRLAAVDTSTENKIILAMWRQMDVREVALSIAYNGYYQHEPLFAVKERGRYTVLEGNRRLAAVRLLLDKSLRDSVGASDLPTITAARRKELSKLPVILATRESLWQYVGFKHINGPQSWGSYEKAKYICEVHNDYGVPLEELARCVGDGHSTVLRLYKGYMILEQATGAAQFSLENKYKTHFSFSHLYTGLRYPGISKFIGVSPTSPPKARPVPPSKLKNLGELLLWMYGSAEDEVAPLIRTQNPDLRRLDAVLQSSNGVAALREGLGLKVGEQFSKGDEVVLREALAAAKSKMQTARGVVATGFDGETDLYRMAEAIAQLASDVLDDMDRRNLERRAARRGGKKSARKKSARKKSSGSRRRKA